MIILLIGLFAANRYNRLESVVRDMHIPHSIRMDAFRMLEKIRWG